MTIARHSIIELASAAALLCQLAACDVATEAELAATQPLPTTLAEDSDIAGQLAAIPGLDVVEVPEQAPAGYRFFLLTYDQPVDHDNPAGPRFSQHMALLHVSTAAPMIFEPEGYELFAPYVSEPTALLGANQLSVEHRYFGGSRPEPTDWQYLTIEQAAADHHRIVEAIRPLYDAAWVSTGVSKGGMTALYHRRFFPGDIDATIAYVAPLSYGPRDLRYISFLNQVGDSACRQKIRALQREALLRRDRLQPIFEELAALYGTGFTRIGGVEVALDIAVAELGFQFWQYTPAAACNTLPGLNASDDDFIQLLGPTGFYATDLGVEAFLPYYYQAMTQLGYPRLPTLHFKDLLRHDPNDYTLYTGDMAIPDFDYMAMIDIAFWAYFEAESVFYIYGENDPWTAGAFPNPPQGVRDIHDFVVPEGTHAAKIADLVPADQDRAHAVLEAWTGVTVDGSSNALRTPALRSRERARGWHVLPPGRM